MIKTVVGTEEPSLTRFLPASRGWGHMGLVATQLSEVRGDLLVQFLGILNQLL